MAWVVVTVVLAAVAASAEEPAQALARGKLEADLGHHTVAAEAFASVARMPQAAAPERWEALVRLGVARRDAGDARGSADAFEEAWRTHGKDPEALRFLLQAVGSALPGQERWEKVWREVALEVDRRTPERPEVRVTWPGVPYGLCPCSGARVSLDFKDGDLQDVFRLIADASGENVVVNPGTQGKVTLRVVEKPWDEVLDSMLAPNGLVARRSGNLVWIGRPEEAGEKRTFTGKPITFRFVDVDLVEALRQVASNGGARVEVDDGIGGRVTLQLERVPWDQAFDVLAVVNALTWTRTGDVIHVQARRRGSSR
jgi:hypothetical protein